MRRRSAAVLALAGAACLAAAALGITIGAGPARAEGEPGSEFGAFALTAQADGLKILGPDPNIEGFVSHALATFSSGPVGYALASTAWPGRAGGNLGTVLLVLGNPACSPPDERIPPPPTCPPLPPETTLLNFPVRAESSTGTGEVTNNTIPGLTMFADTGDSMVIADATTGRAEAEGLGIGSARSTSTTTLTGPKAAVAEATSRLVNLSIAGGTIRIGSVVSTASASTDAAQATATGSTTVNDATIAGVPVTIDRDGIHVQGNDLPVGEAIRRVNEGLSRSGLTITVSEPILTSRGAGDVTYSAGSVLVSWIPSSGDPPTEQHVFTIVLGGATVSAAAQPGFDFDFDDFVPPPFEPPPFVEGGLPPAAEPAPGAPTTPGAPATGQVAQIKLSPGVGAGWIALAVVGAVLVGAGAHRFPVRFLADAGVSCSVEGGS